MLKFVSSIWYKRWLYTGIVIAAIFYLTLVPRPLPPDMEMDIPGLDKLVHAIMFGGLAGTAILDYAYRGHHRFATVSVKAMAIICALSALTGGAIEIAQDAMKMGRGGDILDFIADITGAVIGTLVAAKILKKSRTN